MKATGGVLGILGGTLGITAGLLAPAGEIPLGFGVAAIIISVLGILGGSIATVWPRAAGVIMLVAAVGGFVVVLQYYIGPAILLLIGGILATIAGTAARGTARP